MSMRETCLNIKLYNMLCVLIENRLSSLDSDQDDFYYYYTN